MPLSKEAKRKSLISIAKQAVFLREHSIKLREELDTKTATFVSVQLRRKRKETHLTSGLTISELASVRRLSCSIAGKMSNCTQRPNTKG